MNKYSRVFSLVKVGVQYVYPTIPLQNLSFCYYMKAIWFVKLKNPTVTLISLLLTTTKHSFIISKYIYHICTRGVCFVYA